MKKLFYYIFLFCALSACKKKELMTYEGSDNVTFNYNGVRDSSVVTFRSVVGETLDAELAVKLTGKVSDRDRKFKIVPDDKITTARAGIDYEALTDTFKIAAGKVDAKIKIRLHKAQDVGDKQYVLALRLVPNENFEVELKSYKLSRTVALDMHRIMFSNRLIINPTWNTSRLGTFYPKKVQLLIDIAKMDPVIFYKPTGSYTSAQYFNMGRTLQLYLNEQKGLGNIILNDDGTVMKMGTTVQ